MSEIPPPDRQHPEKPRQNLPPVFQFKLRTLFAVIALLSIPLAHEAKRHNKVWIAKRQTADLESAFSSIDMYPCDLDDHPTCAAIDAQSDSDFWHILSHADRCSSIEHLALRGAAPSPGTLRAIAELPRLRFLQIGNGSTLTARDIGVLGASVSLKRISLFPRPQNEEEMQAALPHRILLNDWHGEMHEYNILSDGNRHFAKHTPYPHPSLAARRKRS